MVTDRRSILVVLIAGVVVLHAGVALVFLLGAPERTSSVAFVAARRVLPVHVWALLFALVALFLATSCYTGRSQLLAWTSVAGAGVCAWWAVLFAVSATEDPRAALVPIVMWTSAAFSHLAIAVGTGLLSRGG